MQTGRTNGRLVTTIPLKMTREVLERGQERFNIYCSPCHGRIGDGQGMIVQRGFPHPPDYAIKRLRNAPVGHFYDVITNGYGVMYSYAARVQPEERWAIAAYIRLLQASRPEVPAEQYQQERLRARRTGIGTRPVPESQE
jgi:mono/diheme cytochrome c family protein